MSNSDRSTINKKNTGPKTSEGKAAVAQNRIVHCLTGDRVLLPGEDPDDYAALLHSLMTEHKPQGPTETFLVEQLAHNQHRLTRVAEMEAEIISYMTGLHHNSDIPAIKAASFWVNRVGPEEAHARAIRYETSLRRAYHQALTQLRVTQNLRKREAAALPKQDPPPLPAEPVENTACDSIPDASPSPHGTDATRLVSAFALMFSAQPILSTLLKIGHFSFSAMPALLYNLTQGC